MPGNPAINSKGEIKSRLTIVEAVYYQAQNEDPSIVDARYARWLQVEEQPYTRKFKVDNTWRKLDTGWLDEVGMLWLENQQAGTLVNPTQEELTQASKQILELGAVLEQGSPVTVLWTILQGETFRGQPADISKLWIRCREGVANCLLWAYPQ